jgi:hypothetical protein
MAKGFTLMGISAVGKMRYENMGAQRLESLLNEAYGIGVHQKKCNGWVFRRIQRERKEMR